MSYLKGPSRGRSATFQWIFRACSIVLLSTGLRAAPTGQKHHKLRVSDPAAASEIVRNGGELIADYGAFQLLAVDEKTASQLGGNPKASDVSHHNTIELNAGALHTTSDEVKALRNSAIAGPG